MSQQAEAGEGKEHGLSPPDLWRIPRQGPRTSPTQPTVGGSDLEDDGFPFLKNCLCWNLKVGENNVTTWQCHGIKEE